MIPQPRGGAALRGRGTSTYQAPRGGAVGRGRGGQQRGGMNPGAQTFSPTGATGQKRPREEGSIGGGPQGNAGKRARGGGGQVN